MIYRFFKEKIFKHWPILILILICGSIFGSLLSSRTFPEKDGVIYSGGSSWGDLAFHATLASNFKERGLVSVLKNDPIFSDHPFRYHFIFDWFSGQLMKAGLSLRQAFFWPSFVCFLIFLILFYFFVFSVFQKRIAAFFAPLIFIFNGSIFGFWRFLMDFKKSDSGFLEFFWNVREKYSLMDNFNLHLSNFFTDFLLPQRAFLPALVLGILAIWFLWLFFKKDRFCFIAAFSVILGFMPLLHTQTFLCLSLAAFFLAILDLLSLRKSFNLQNREGEFFVRLKKWLWAGLIALILSLPQIIWIFGGLGKNFIFINLGWLANSENFFLFWLKNGGLALILIPFALFSSKISKDFKIFYSAFVFLFLLANIFSFQPYVWDNTKMFLWWFLLSAVLLSGWLSENMVGKKRLKIGFSIIVFLLLLPTGILAVVREKNLNWPIFSAEDVRLAEFIKNNSGSESLFIINPKHNHSVSCLAGRKIFMGYPGWLWSHGFDYSQKQNMLFDVFSGRENAKSIIDQNGIDYVVLEKNAGEYDFNLLFFVNSGYFVETYRSENYFVFRVLK